MKRKKFTIFLTALLMLIWGGEIWGQTTTYTLVSKDKSTYYQEGYIVGVIGDNCATWTADGFVMTQNKNSSSNNVTLIYNEIRVYASHSINFEATENFSIVRVVATATSAAYANALGNGTNNNCTTSVSSSIVTITPTNPGAFSLTLSNQSRLNKIEIEVSSNTPQQTCATPTFSPEAGTYTETQSVTISCATPEATIYYTTDGSAPTTSSTLYSSAIEVSTTTTIKAIAVKDGLDNSEVATAEYVINNTPTCEAPTISPNGGTFNEPQTVTLSAADGLYIFYSTNGTDPSYTAWDDENVFEYNAENKPVISASCTLKAVAYDDANGVHSTIASAVFTISAPATPHTVTFDPGSGTCGTISIIEASVGAGVSLPDASPSSACISNGWTFAGWKETSACTETTVAPTLYATGTTYYPTANCTLYAVYANSAGGSETWVLTDLSSVAPGVYAIVNQSNYAFNGTISSGHGNCTSSTFTFTDGEASSAPTGTCEITIAAVTGGFTMYNADKGYLYASKAASGGLAWHASETSYWSYASSNWTYANNSAYLRSYNSTTTGFRTYGANNGDGVIKLAKKTAGTTYNSNPSCEEPTQVATPTFSPEAGTYTETQSVTISCETQDATIYYTTDGSAPTTSSTLYSSAIEVSTTTTIKAIAVKDGLDNSDIATATYTIRVINTIAEARALENNAYALVRGIVTYINGNTIYIQDQTGGIVLYLNNNTTPGILALGDQVLAYGEKTVYYGLVELIGINGEDTNVFNIESSGNTLPLAIKTIQEINTDYNGSSSLQATRIKIENATIGKIDANGSTPITQGENTTNIYKIPTLDGISEGDIINVIGVIGCHDAAQILVYTATDIEKVVTPTILTASTLTVPSYSFGSIPQDFEVLTVNGSNLTQDITVETTSDYFVFSSDLENWTTSLTISMIDGSVTNEEVAVRLKAGLEIGTYEGELTLSSTGAETVVVSLSGTVTQNYEITCVFDNNKGMIGASPSSAYEGQTVTLSHTEETGYILSSIDITKTADGSATGIIPEASGDDYTFTMPGYAVTVTATFTVLPTYTITFDAGNGTCATASITQETPGETIILPTCTPLLEDASWSFIGWSETDLGKGTTDAITPLTNYTPMSDVTLYAVYKKTKTELGTCNLTNANIVEAGEPSTGYSSHSIIDKCHNTWTAFAIRNYHSNATSDYYFLQIKANTYNDHYYLQLPLFPANITEINITVSNTSKPMDGGGNTATLYLTTNEYSGTDMGSGTGQNSVTITPTENTRTGYITASSAVRIWDVSVSYRETINTYATSPDYNIEGNNILTDVDIPAGTVVTINSGVTLTVTGTLTNTNHENLIIEDGGQLIINNAGVQATVQKNISAYTDNEGTDNYYFIGSPVAENVAGQFAQGTYDLYKYDEATAHWKNYEAANFDIELGYGYLYANNEGRTVGMVGEVNVGTINITDLSYTTGSLAGFHLFGNPYTHDIYYGEGFVLAEDYSGYYVPNAVGELVVKEMAEPVKAGQGFMMQIVEGGDEIEFNNTNAAPTAKRATKLTLQLTVGNGHFEDNAYLIVSDGYGLGKLSHFNENAPMLWIRNNDADYAIATMTEIPNSIPLCFKAGTTAKYTIRMKATGQYSYLHLIDRLTGDDIDMLIEGEYSFIGSPRDNAERFIVKFNNNSNSDTPENDIFAYQNGDELFVTGNGTIQVFDVTGRFVQSKEVHGNTSMSISSLPKGVYIFRLIGSEIKTQKIVVR